jgi:hypothetical protein
MNIFEYIKNELDTSEVKKIMKELGSDFKEDNKGNLKFKTICHGGDSYKLYYFIDSKLFRCFTECQKNYSLIDLVGEVKGFELKESINFIKKVLDIEDRGVTSKIGFNNKNLISDWVYLNKYDKDKKHNIFEGYEKYNEKILGLFKKELYYDWYEEEIYNSAIEKFNIRLDIVNERIIIPHYDIYNNLIGIRVRNLDEDSVGSGFKYMPMIYNKKIYSHQLQFNLYGLNKNVESIKKTSKIMIFESEKSVLRCNSYYGDLNFTVACCGSNISEYQRDLVVQLGVREVFLAFDKEYKSHESEKAIEYAEKIKQKALMFSPYCTVYVLWDSFNVLDEKDSPVDKGKEIMEFLMKNKIEIKTLEDTKL